MLTRLFSMGASCSPSSVRALPSVGFSPGLAVSADEAPGVASSRSEKSASQSFPSAPPLLPPEPVADPFWCVVAGAAPGLPPTPAVLPPPPVDEPRLAKSKLLSMPNGADVPVRFDSDLVACEAGGDESKTGLKSSRPDRLMVAKSSSADPSLASSSPSKSSSRSSNGALLAAAAWPPPLLPGGAGCEVLPEPKISSSLGPDMLLTIVAGAVGVGVAAFSLFSKLAWTSMLASSCCDPIQG